MKFSIYLNRRVFIMRYKLESFSYLANVQVYLSLCWSHRSYCQFYRALAQLHNSRSERKTVVTQIYMKPVFRSNFDPLVNNENLGAIAHTSNGT